MVNVAEEKSDDEWSVKISVSIPKDLFCLLKNKSVPPNIVRTLKTVSLAVENFLARTIVDCCDSPFRVCDVFFRFHCEDMPSIREPVGLYVRLRNVRVVLGGNQQSPSLKEVTLLSPFPPPFIKSVIRTVQMLISLNFL